MNASPEEEGKEDLHAGLDDAQLLKELGKVTVGSRLGFPHDAPAAAVPGSFDTIVTVLWLQVNATSSGARVAL